MKILKFVGKKFATLGLLFVLAVVGSYALELIPSVHKLPHDITFIARTLTYVWTMITFATALVGFTGSFMCLIFLLFDWEV